jgi:Flp pilus assembly protein TadG
MALDLNIFRIVQTTRLLRGDRRAVAAIEFAMLGSVALLFIIAFLLMAVFQFWQSALDDAVRAASRQMVADVGQGQSPTSQTFVAAVCAEFGRVAPCSASSLQIDVQNATTFGAMTNTATVSSAGTLSATGFNMLALADAPGSGGQAILFQVAYAPPFLPQLPFLPNVVFTGNSTPVLISAVSFMEF